MQFDGVASELNDYIRMADLMMRAPKDGPSACHEKRLNVSCLGRLGGRRKGDERRVISIVLFDGMASNINEDHDHLAES